MIKDQCISLLRDQAAPNSNWHWYAIADSAQHKALPDAISVDGGQQRCLLDAPVGSPLAAQAPHLVQLPSPSEGSDGWKWIARNVPGLPCATVIATTLEFDQLFDHLKPFTEVLLPDGDDMFFAFWDPAILAVLVGQADDPTLYVKGPVLTAEQRAAFTQGIAGWWYWDREGSLRSVRIEAAAADAKSVQDKLLDMPLQLTQTQVDDLVETSVPDHVLHYVELNQGHLLNDIKPRQRYEVVLKNLVAARDIKLDTMSDLVNYVCTALIYKDQFKQDKTIQALLGRVEKGELQFAQALELMP
jgi:Domain of unknown function (DUF4123)